MKDKKSCEDIKHQKFAAGMEDELEASAGKKAEECGETTRVTRMSWDEVDPSHVEK